MIPFQDLRKTNEVLMERLAAAAGRVIRSGRYINGPEVKAFEKALALLCESRYCVAVSNGLDALRLIFAAYKEMGLLRDGDEVIVPANTFVASFLAVTHSGLKAVAADVDDSTFCLDWTRLPLSPRTRAVLTVHLYGYPCWDAAAVEALRARGILVIEDAAQAIGARSARPGFRGTFAAGSLADAAAFSFYPAKNIGALGDAGAVVTDDSRLAATVRTLANYGAPEKYSHTLCGFNCRMDELQAALLSEKLPLASTTARERGRRARLYASLITNPEVTLPPLPSDGSLPAFHQFVVRHPRRDQLRAFLASKGVRTEVHYPVPCHLQECYNDHPLLLTPSPLPTAERLAGEVLSLPIADVSDADIREIAKLINSCPQK